MSIFNSRERLALGALIVLSLVALAGGFQWIRRAQPAPLPVEANAVPVRLSSVSRQDLPIWINAIGNVQALNSVNVRVRVDGEVQKILFNEGQMVTGGSLLAVIDPRVYQAQVAQAQALVAKDQAQLANLRVNLDRASKLAAAKAGPTQDVDTFRAQLAAQHATVQADQAALDSARLQLEFTQVKAPFTGRTGQRLLDVGAIAHGAEATGLVTITQMNPISVAFAVSQDDLAQILEENAKGSLQVVAMTRDGHQAIVEGRLSFVDSQVAAVSGQVQLKAQFDNAAGKLWPGELVSARLLVQTLQDVTVVPAEAVQFGRQGSFVYVVGDDQRVQPRQVDVGAVVDGKQWIRQGLSAGETVVVQGQSRVAPGVKVMAANTDNAALAEAKP
ncbi:efflux RND transporter periplasmic adaptor subunit [Pseudomonas syringae pv. theae]|uniref:efflux RND transporter periplasmic adaptor subunit n=1 Tax=Pseudomonas syringae TaxID=317 RepID=UPI001EECFEDA|nr:efflux RND transporter periplasmic adaptor subunit [Pseudomonas syringae]MBL3831969.1 efflux RND transporter periplasmic adaptor subunit [Pseudomonas syringae pv. theae]MBL3836222.1 efflux RND transporter periplasmic adaptor subunit [Pseudomonas syringae pv. theae]MBL3868368.1 efflux RND transporter periplasmic adaptor subunit [Pseudomonas syringae pv. theae]GKQ48647.1 efflux RND transporter periplasmic adaptor subunit [Pseudomonas syringae pv. theae]GKS08542.1 efflux RND transporter peripl